MCYRFFSVNENAMYRISMVGEFIRNTVGDDYLTEELGFRGIEDLKHGWAMNIQSKARALSTESKKILLQL